MLTKQQNELVKVIRERQAIKRFDPSFQFSDREIVDLLEDANRAPSAWNLQHWKFIVFNEPDARQKLLPIANGQQQIVEASAVIAVLGDLEAYRNAEDVYRPAVQNGQLREDAMRNIIEQIEDAYLNVPSAARDEAIRNASLAAMQLMLAAKARGLDTGPIGGFDTDRFREAFQVPARYVPVLLIVVGKAAAPTRATHRIPIRRKITWNRFSP